MMGAWVDCALRAAPTSRTVMVRLGGSICFAAYSRLQDCWLMIAGRSETKITAPQYWWDRLAIGEAQEAPPPQRSRPQGQLSLTFGGGDSGKLSARKVAA